MINFITGFFIGAFVGIIIMSLLIVGRSKDNNE